LLCSVVDPFTFAAVVAELPAAAPEPEADEEGNVPEQEAHCARNACWPAGLLACWLLAAGCWLLAAGCYSHAALACCLALQLAHLAHASVRR
jgi:hypothetical protein